MKNEPTILLRRITVFVFIIGFSLSMSAQKFVGNIIQSSIPSEYSQYWNQVTPENSGKWGSTEPYRDSYSWGGLDVAYNYAMQNGFPFKQHTFVWGAQEPGWIGSLSQTDQRAEVEEWIRDYFIRYPKTQLVDVVNEPLHQPPSYRWALGGSGTTGWDWVITAFEMARRYAPSGCKLLINEYGIISNPTEANNYVNIINLLKSRGLIDGIGIQCHSFNMDNVSTGTMNQVLGILSATGLPIYVSELDMRGTDSEQLYRYQTKFPVFWENPNVKGITLWGYKQGTMWEAEAYLLTYGGTPRPALSWLMNYIKTSNGSNTIVVRARGENGSEHINLKVNNVTIASWTLGTSYQDYSASTDYNGDVIVQFDNDDGNVRDVQVDYVIINGSTRQSEDQSYNTGVYQDGSCGGSYSEWLHCNGSISYGDVNTGNTITVRARGIDGSEHINLKVNNVTIANWTLGTSYQDYNTSTTSTGDIIVQFDNDDGTVRDVQVDYVIVNGTTRQAEDQSSNTGVWQNSNCGGSYSEWLHCNGSISFGDVTTLKAAKDEQISQVQSKEIFVYPNPVNDVLNISLGEEHESSIAINIFNATGALVKQVTMYNSSIEVDLSGLNSGIYYLHANNGTEVVVSKFIKK